MTATEQASLEGDSSARVSMNARVAPDLRAAARKVAEERGMALNDLIIAAVAAYCQPPPPPTTAAPPVVPVEPVTLPAEHAVAALTREGVDPAERPGDLLRLYELLAVDMHVVRAVLQRAFPQEVAEAKQETRGWLLRLRSVLPVAPPTREGGQGRGRPC